jgi:hypothetical protein
MGRGLLAYLLLALAVTIATAVIYVNGAPVWSVYIGLVVALLVALPGWERWDARRHPR